MNDFDRLLETELSRILDRVVRTPPPPRRRRSESHPLLKLYPGSHEPTGRVAKVVVLADAPLLPRAEVAFTEPGAVSGPVIFS
jgi:hypothetical protein